MDTNQKAALVEAQLAEKTVALVELTEGQTKALTSMDKQSELNSIAKSVVASRIKGMYKAYKDSAQKAMETLYDDASRRGFKHTESKHDFIKREMIAVNEIYNQL